MIKISSFFAFFLMICSALQAQSDTIFLIGNARKYNDSVVLRWNGKNYKSFLGINSGIVVIEKRNNLEDNWKKADELKSKKVENWPVSKVNPNTQIVLAAAGIQQMNSINEIKDPKHLDERENDLDYLWMNVSLAADLNVSAADLSNLRYVDKKISASENSMYRIYIKNSSYISDTLYFILGNETYSPENIHQPRVVEKEKVVELFWKYDKKYTAYFVEKSENGKNNFRQLNRAPIVIPSDLEENALLFFYDSVVNYKIFQYRIYAVDMFGNKSQYTELISACGRDRTAPPMPAGFDVRENTDNTLVLSWKPIGKAFGEKGLTLGMKHNNEEAYQPLTTSMLPISQQKYIVKPVSGITDYYFLLQVFDTAGNSSYAEAFYQLNDNTAPSKPLGLKAVVNKQGVVQLTWNWNSEKDLDGYLIYTSNSPNTEFGGIVNTPYYDTVFYDTLSLKMLNKEVFYKVVAADKRFNLSENSEIVKVLRPDTLPPVSPIIKNYFVTDSVISLHWIKSSSVDVERHYLYRKSRKTGKLTAFALNPKDSIFKDRTFVPQEEYVYYLTAVDMNNNVSPNSNAVVLKSYVNYFLPEVKVFTAQYDSIAKTVVLTWDYPMEKVEKISIYKGNEFDKISRMPVQIKPGTTTFSDSKIQPGKTVFYAIKMHFTDGTETRISNPLGVYVK